MKSKKKSLTPEEKLSQALLPREEWPYELPKGWVWTRVEPFVQVIRGVAYKKNDVQNISAIENALILRGGNIEEGAVNLKTNDNVFVDKRLISEAQYIKENDVVIVASTGSKSVIGKAGIVYKECPNVAIGAFLLLIRPLKDVNSRYVDYYFETALYRNNIRKLANGVNINNVKQNYIKKSPFPLPPLPEQQRIVGKIESLFAKLDEAGDRLQKVLDGYEARRAAILHEAFSGKWTGDHGAGDMSVPKGWRKVKLSDVCTINPKKLDTSSLEDSLEVSFIPMASVDEVLGEVTKPDVRNLGKVKKGFTNFQEGDVVFAKITPCMENGKSAVIGPLLNDIGYGTTEFYVLRCHPELYNRFLYHLVRSIKFRSEAKSQMTGAVGQQRVPKNFMADYEILLPPLNEQIQIVQMVDTFFKKEYEVRKMSQNVIEQISLLKKSILARAFRGELGTQDSSDPSALELLKECVLAGKEVSKS